MEIVKSDKLYVGFSKEIEKIAISVMKQKPSNELTEKVENVARLIRKDIKNFDKRTEVYYSFTPDCEKNSVPDLLLQFMSVLLEGHTDTVTGGVLTASQITMYNFRAVAVVQSDDGHARRHIYKNPLVEYVSLKLFNT